VISLARRGARLKRELENIKQLVQSSDNMRDQEIENRVR
jgi:hypothetical protein